MSPFIWGKLTYREGDARAKALREGAGMDPRTKGPELLKQYE